MRLWVSLVAISACGRIGFEAPATTLDDAGDPTDGPTTACPPTYADKPTGCYRIGTGLSASSAEQACEADGGHLAIIETQAENDALTALAAGQSAWIGLVDQGSGFVLLTSGTPPIFEHWAPGDPNGDGTCVRLLSNTGDWDDEPCTKAQSFLCEVDGKFAIVTP